MIAALDARDSAALRQVLVDHLQRKRDTVLALMREGAVLAPAAAAGAATAR